MDGNWITLLQNFGVAVVMLGFLGWGAIRVCKWGAPRIEKWVDSLFAGVEKISQFEARIVAVEDKIMTLWDFQLRRARVEALQAGIGKMNSPFQINDEAKAWIGEMANELRAFYRRLGRLMTEAELVAEIEKRWGKELVEKVCIPHGLYQGACLLIAMEVAKEGANSDSGV